MMMKNDEQLRCWDECKRHNLGDFRHFLVICEDVMEDMKLYNYTQPYTTNNLICVTFAFNRETLNHGIFECRVSRRSQIRLEWHHVQDVDEPVFGFMKIAFLHFCERKKHRNESKISFFSETLFDVH